MRNQLRTPLSKIVQVGIIFTLTSGRAWSGTNDTLVDVSGITHPEPLTGRLQGAHSLPGPVRHPARNDGPDSRTGHFGNVYCLAEPANRLVDSGFELRTPPGDGGWLAFNGAAFSSAYSHGGQWSMYDAALSSVPGSFEQFPALPGSQWRVTGYGMTPVWLRGWPAFGIVQLSFFDSFGNDLGTTETCGTGTRAKTSEAIDFTSTPGEWKLLDTGIATAPPGTVAVQAFTIYVDFTGTYQGVYFDDLCLQQVGGPPWADAFLDENFEALSGQSLVGWQADSTEVASAYWGYFDSAGVGGSVAMQEGAYFLGWGGLVGMMYQNGAVRGNVGATRTNTMLSFDLLADSPNLTGLTVGLQSWSGPGWQGNATASHGDIPLGACNQSASNGFQTVTAWLGDPLWVPDVPAPWSATWTGPFEPTGGTYQVFFQLDAWLCGGPGSFGTVTVDNLRFWTVPSIQEVKATPAVLWPPNHRMIDVCVDYSVSDPVAEVTSSVSVTSNESGYGWGERRRFPDWEIVDAHHVRLRAERSGNAAGRVYTITITSVDALGNTASQAVTVAVPPNHGHGDED